MNNKKEGQYAKRVLENTPESLASLVYTLNILCQNKFKQSVN
jgi:hypothetical protein